MVLSVAVFATLATSRAAGQVSSSADGGLVVLGAGDRPIAAIVTISATDRALIQGAEPGWQIESEELELGRRDGPLLPVDVTAWRVTDGERSHLALQRGQCRGHGCLGTFEIAFRLASDAGHDPVHFGWSVYAFVNFQGAGEPEGAAVAVEIIDVPDA